MQDDQARTTAGGLGGGALEPGLGSNLVVATTQPRVENRGNDREDGQRQPALERCLDGT